MVKHQKHTIVVAAVFVLFWAGGVKARQGSAKSLPPETAAGVYAQFLADADLASAEAKAAVIKGAELTKTCAETNAECLYYAGLFARERVTLRQINAKAAWPQILQRLQASAFVNDTLDSAGAYRALSQAYLDFPKSPSFGKDYMQNLDTAWVYAAKSLKIASLDARNLLVAGRVRLAQKDAASANLYFKKAKAQLANYKGPKAEKARLKVAIDAALKADTQRR